MNKKEVTRQFAKYVSQNILGMIGISLYILADTFFISKAVGADGITALNLVLPLYNFIFALGLMIGVGAAIRYSVAASHGRNEGRILFMNSIECGIVIGRLHLFLFVIISAMHLSEMITDPALQCLPRF